MNRRASTSFASARASRVMAALGFCLPATLRAQASTSGIVPSRWEGEVPGGASPLRVALSIIAGANGSTEPRVFLDIPDAGVLGNAAAFVVVRGDSIRFSIPMRDSFVPFAGGVRGNQMDGVANMGAPVPVHLTRVAIPELPYRMEEITVRHDSIRLASTLYLPSSLGPHPAIIFHHGAYADTRNVWAFWADHFARMGAATLIYDNRGAGQTNGEPHVGFEDLAGDALACVAQLKSDARIRGNEIGLFSGSQGGWVASIAAARSSDVAFVVMLAGPGESIARNVLHESESKLRAAKFSDSDITAALAAKQRIEAAIAGGASDDAIDRARAEVEHESWFPYVGIVPQGHWHRAWWRLIGAFDPGPNWSRVHIPVVVLDGTRDTQVPVAESHAAFARAFANARNPDFTFLVFAGAGHNLQLDGPIPVFAPGVMQGLSAWVASHVTLPPLR